MLPDASAVLSRLGYDLGVCLPEVDKTEYLFTVCKAEWRIISDGIKPALLNFACKWAQH